MVYAANSIWPKLVWHSETLQLDPKEPLAQLYFAVATQETGDFDEALKLYRQVTVRFPDFAPALTGWVTSQAGAVMKQKTCFVV
jgi:cytochrome c-type biogenesis protein CcmH/NrfG